MRVRYYPSSLDPCVGPEDAHECDTTWDGDFLDYVAEDCAQDLHRNHDGWELSWPLTLKLWDRQGDFLGEWEVDRDVEPVFHAAKRKDQNDLRQ